MRSKGNKGSNGNKGDKGKKINKKYELTDQTRVISGRILHRIRAVKSFASVRRGDFGGWIEKEKNLSHDGNAWVYDNACVYDNARVSGGANVLEDAWVKNNASVYDDAYVSSEAQITGHARIYGNARIGDYALLGNNAQVYGDARVCDNVFIYDNARVCGEAYVRGNAKIGGDALVKEQWDCIVFENCWSSGRCFTYTRSNKKWKVGCFYGTGKELIEKAYKDSELSGRCYEATVEYVRSIERFIMAERKKRPEGCIIEQVIQN